MLSGCWRISEETGIFGARRERSADGWILYRRGAAGNKLKMTLGLPVYVNPNPVFCLRLAFSWELRGKKQKELGEEGKEITP